jgi:signal transduction histidine kinase
VSEAKETARILVVDDDERNRRLLRAMIEADDHAVVEASDGEQALELARLDPPDAILLDIMMPGIDGYEVARRLKADAATRAIPIVMLTALDDRGSRVAALEAGAEEFVSKPVDRVELRARVRNLLRLKHIMTELGQARDAAQAADRAKSTFLATMSHEIRTPMNGVIGTLEILERTSLQRNQVELVTTMRESAQSLLGVIDDILDFSKIEAGKLELEHRPLSLAHTVESACDALHALASRKGVDLALFTDPRLPPWILGDAGALRQILNNLIGNGIKFSTGTETRGRVSVRAEPDDPSHVRLAIADNGIGMPPEVMERIFTPFIQGESTTSRRFGGTGLGLSICRRLVELLGGSIRVSSVPGRGSEFTVVLPMEPAEIQHTGDTLPSLAGLECVIVSPDAERAADWRAYLEHAGALAVVRGSATTGAPTPAAGEQGRTVFITDLGYAPDIAGSRPPLAMGAEASPHVVVARGAHGLPRTDAQGVVCVGGDALHQGDLLRAVALAAGLALPEVESVRQLSVDPPDAAAGAPKGLILVAEDNETNQMVIGRQLALLGYASEVVGDGRAALERWRSGRFALLLTDVHMPEMDGYELSTAIRREEAEGVHRPIIALTALAMKGDDARCRQAGMDDYLSKPLQLDRLGAVLTRWLPPAEARGEPPTP